MGDTSFSVDEKKRSSTPDVLKSRIRQSTDLNVPDGEEDSEEGTLQPSDQSPVVRWLLFFVLVLRACVLLT